MIPTRASRRRRRGGGKKHVIDDDVFPSEPVTPEELNPPPSPFLSHDKGARESVLVDFELLAQHIVSIVVFL